MAFQGFSPKLPEFLKNVSEKNSKLWYEAHKKEFIQYVRDPFYEFIALFAEQMREIDGQIITEPKRCLSRIFKDARYAKDGSLYRNRMWLTFKRPAENWLEIPAFYFEITDSGCFYGMGYYTARASTMECYRKFIAAHPRVFQKAVRPVEDDAFLRAEGETYKKEKPGCPKGLEGWYQFKNFSVNADRPLSFLQSPDLVAEVSEAFDKTKELYRILSDEVPAQREESAWKMFSENN